MVCSGRVSSKVADEEAWTRWGRRPEKLQRENGSRALTCRTYFIVVQMLQVVNINPEANSALHTLGDRMMFLKCATHVIVVVIASRRAVP